MTRMRAVLSGLAALALCLAALPARAQDLVEVLARNPDLSTFAAYVKASGLEAAMKEKGPITILAPTNAAFARMDPNILERLRDPQNRPALQEIIKYHVLPGDYPQARLAKAYQDTFRVTTPEGNAVFVDVSRLKRQKGPFLVDGVAVNQPEAKATNGNVFVIGAVLLPPKHRGLAPKAGAAAAAPPAPPARSPEPAPAAKPAAVERAAEPEGGSK